MLPENLELVHFDLILHFLFSSEIQRLRATSRSLCNDAEPHLRLRSRAFLEKMVPDAAARMHYQEIFESSDENSLLLMRQWLVNVDDATRFGQWRTQTAVARLMTGVSMDASDLFAAVKRAYLASQVPCLSNKKHVVLWMHVLGALEEQDPIQSKLMAAEAWEALATEIKEHTVLWVIQSAHFVSATWSKA